MADDQLSQLIGDLVFTTSRLTRIAAHATSAASGMNVSAALWRTLSVLQVDGDMRLGELAASSRVTQPTMTNLVNTLVESGWVKRTPDATDARASLISIAPAGVDALASWRSAVSATLRPYFADLTDEDREHLQRSVEILDKTVIPKLRA